MEGNQYLVHVIEISTPSGNMVRLQNGLIKFAAVSVRGMLCSYVIPPTSCTIFFVILCLS